MNTEKIFVVVPVYKVEAYLERCIDSILNQTYTNWELVLVDDGSPDNSGAICDRYAAQYENITVIHQENGGVSAARNAAIEFALNRGDLGKDWLNFIDSDDFVHPKYLEYLHRAAKEAGVDISGCAYIETRNSEIENMSTQQFRQVCMSAEDYWCKQRNAAAVVWGKLQRLSLVREIRFPLGKFAEDQFFSYKLIFQCTNIAFVPEKLYYYYLSDNSIMRTAWSPRRLDGLDAREEHIAFFKENGYQQAYRLAIRELYLVSIANLRYIGGVSSKYRNFRKIVRAKSRSALRMYLREEGLKNTVKFIFDGRIRKPIKYVLRNESIFAFLKRRLIKYIYHR